MSSAGPSCEPIGVPLDTKRGDAYGLTVDFDNFSDSLVVSISTNSPPIELALTEKVCVA